MKITTNNENNAALVLIELLMQCDPEPSSKDGAILRYLVEKVQDYVKKYDLS